MTRYLAQLPCPVCKRSFEREITRAEMLNLEGMVKVCGREDCAPPRPAQIRKASPSRQRAAPRSLETPLVNACLQLLAWRNIDAWRQNQGALHVPEHLDENQRLRKRRYVQFSGREGIADIIGFIPPSGRFLAVECKVRPRKPTKEQAEFLAAVNDCGGIGLLVVDDVAELDRQLREAGY